MELDDLKDIWKHNAAKDEQEINKENLADKLQLSKSSRQSIKNAFFLECAVVVFIYVAFFIFVYLFKPIIYSFIYKMLVVIFITSIPVFFRLYKSMKWMDQLDYSASIGRNVKVFLDHLKITLRIYQIISLASVIIISLICLTDSSFLALHAWIRVTIIVYLVLFGILTKPYLDRLYGKRIKSFEHFLNQDL